MKKIIYIIVLALLFIGCQQQQKVDVPNQIFKPEPIQKTQVDMSGLFEAEKEDIEDELYFKDSKGKAYQAKSSNSKLKWIEVHIPHSNNKDHTTFNIMSRNVSKKDFLGNGSDSEPMTNISYEAANNFCSVKFDGAVLSTPYIFEHARRSSALVKPNSPEFIEMISPVDYEDFDDTFFVKGDNLESSDDDVSTMITFHWGSQKYYAISLSYKSSDMGFRCYK